MDEHTLRTQSEKYNAATQQNQGVHEEYNSVKNYAVLTQALKDGRARDISDEPKKNGEPCFIISSGPSLDKSIEYLKDWKGGIICTTSHALTLMHFGIEPTHILILDPFSEWKEIKGVDWSRTRTKLIAHPGAWPNIIAKWPNEILLYRQNLARRDTYYATYQARMYTERTPKEGSKLPDDFEDGDAFRDAQFEYLVRTEITSFACSPPAQMFMAEHLGYGRIFLAGCDYAYPDGKSRCNHYTVKVPARVVQSGNAGVIEIPPVWEKHEHPLDPEANYLTTANGLPTEEIHLYYKKNHLSSLRLSLQDVYTTDHGALTEIPYADIEKVVRTQGKGFERVPHKKIIDLTEKYLAKVGAFIVDCGPGLSFLECEHPLDWQDEKGQMVVGDLQRYMQGLRNKYECKACGAIGTAPETDTKDYEGENCQHCKTGKMKHKNKPDIEANLKRVKKLLGYVESAKAIVQHG